MNMTLRTSTRTFVLASVLGTALLGAQASAQTPEAAGCEHFGTAAADRGVMDHGDMGHGMSTPGTMDHGTGTPGMMHGAHAEFDLMYIDMMIPHHESIIALARAALPELQDPRLQDIAQAIVDTQGPEIEELQQLREAWYGDAAPVPMDMMGTMPGVHDADAMMAQMSAEWQVQAFCAAADKDLAFIDQVIPHHQMAIDTSEAALEHSEHQEIRDIATRAIDAQQAEIAELEAIQSELQATPAS